MIFHPRSRVACSSIVGGSCALRKRTIGDATTRGPGHSGHVLESDPRACPGRTRLPATPRREPRTLRRTVPFGHVLESDPETRPKRTMPRPLAWLFRTRPRVRLQDMAATATTWRP